MNLKKNQIDLIRLITPTTDEERLKLILKNASGFLYYVSVMGITGQKSADLNELKKSVLLSKNTQTYQLCLDLVLKTQLM